MDLKSKIKALIESGEVSQSTIAREAGISTAKISGYLNDSYRGNIANVERELQAWLALRERRDNVKIEMPDFVKTPTSDKIWQALDMSKLLSTLVTVYGASGAGKTKTAHAYAQQQPNAWVITASPSKSTLPAILYELALEAGIHDAPRRKDKLSRLLVKKLSGTQGLVIIDESDHLPYDALEEIRIIQEEAAVGVVLMGNDKVYTRIQGGVNPIHEYARLWSRVGKHYPIKQTSKKDVLAIAQAWGLDMQEHDLSKVLIEIGTKSGGLRTLIQCLKLARLLASNHKLTLQHVLEAKAQLS